MAHDIGQMFYFHEKPWHGLGQRVAQPATMEEALAAGGLDWTVRLVPIVPAGEDETAIEHRLAVVRDDQKPGAPDRVVGVVHPGFKPLQNRDGAKMFDALVGPGSRVYHTGGYLRHGEVIWLLARLPKDIQVGGNDPVEPYLLFTNSHDGSVAIDIRLTTVRVVCRNTLSIALSHQATGKVFRCAHHHGVDRLGRESKAFFQFALRQCDEAQALFNRLADRHCDAQAFAAFMRKVLPDPARPVATDPAIQRGHVTRLATLAKHRAEVERVFASGIPEQDLAPVGESLWGAVNAVTAWVDHQQKIKGDRYTHALLGDGDKLKGRALNQATSLCEPVSARS